MFCLKFCHRYDSVVVARSGYVVQPRPHFAVCMLWLQGAAYVLQWVVALMCIQLSVYGLGLHSRCSGNT